MTVRHQHMKFNHPGDLAPEICTPLVLFVFKAGFYKNNIFTNYPVIVCCVV